MENKKLQAINLMIEDLHTSHANIRIQSLELGCDLELEEIKIALLEHLYEMKSKIFLNNKV
jgi:hypothetical protein